MTRLVMPDLGRGAVLEAADLAASEAALMSAMR